MILAVVVGASALPEQLASKPLVLMLVMAALSLLPFALLLTTSFVKISVVLSILKNAMGTPQIPPAQVVTGLALVLSLYVMAPTGERVLEAVEPVLGQGAKSELLSGKNAGALGVALLNAKAPIQAFLFKHAAKKDRVLFTRLAQKMREPKRRANVAEEDLMVLIPAFVTSELRRAFEIGFLLFIPFLVVDLVISNLLMALGMHMLSPTTISLPFKLLLFVLADGWQLLLRGLVESYV